MYSKIFKVTFFPISDTFMKIIYFKALLLPQRSINNYHVMFMGERQKQLLNTLKQG